MMWSNGDTEPQVKNGREVSGMWASEKQFYDMGGASAPCTLNTPGEQVGHYTQQIWHSTTHIGCGVSQCADDSVLYVCQYYPAGNFVGQLPFCKANKPSDMGQCSDLDTIADPSGLTCTAGTGSCLSDGTICSTADGATTCGAGGSTPVTGCPAGTPASPPPASDSSPPPPPPPPPPPNLCDDKDAKQICEAESRVEPGVSSTHCFNASLPYFFTFPECDPSTWLQDNTRFQEITAATAISEKDMAEMKELVRKTLPPACKTALRCFGSSTVGAKQIVLTVTLPYESKDDFTEDLQLKFRQAIADVAGVPVKSVIIVSITVNGRRQHEMEIEQETVGAWRVRAQHSTGLDVETAVTTPSDPAVLSADNINSQLASQGLPPITSLSVNADGGCTDGWNSDGQYMVKKRNGKDYLRRRFMLYKAEKASLLARQAAASRRTPRTFETWLSPYGNDYSIYDVKEGAVSAEDMLASAEAANDTVTWVLRVLTLGGVIIGLQMLSAPLALAPDAIPFCGSLIGDMAGCVLCWFNCCLGFCCWSFMAGIAWLVVRPIVGTLVLIASIAAALCMFYVSSSKDKLSGNNQADMDDLNDSDVRLSVSIGTTGTDGEFQGLSRDISNMGESAHDLKRRLSSPIYVSSQRDLKTQVTVEDDIAQADVVASREPLPNRPHFPSLARALDDSPVPPPRHPYNPPWISETATAGEQLFPYVWKC